MPSRVIIEIQTCDLAVIFITQQNAYALQTIGNIHFCGHWRQEGTNKQSLCSICVKHVQVQVLLSSGI